MEYVKDVFSVHKINLIMNDQPKIERIIKLLLQMDDVNVIAPAEFKAYLNKKVNNKVF